jgi:hypothetical protein
VKDPIVNISEYDPMNGKYSKKLLTKENVKYKLKCHGQNTPIQHTLTNKVIILNNQINKAGFLMFVISNLWIPWWHSQSVSTSLGLQLTCKLNFIVPVVWQKQVSVYIKGKYYSHKPISRSPVDEFPSFRTLHENEEYAQGCSPLKSEHLQSTT